MTNQRKLSVVLLDDEQAAINMLRYYLKNFPFIDIRADFVDARSAFQWLSENEVDLLITDVEMPHFNGIELMKALVKPPRVIYCTGHDRYGAQTYETHAIDFLSKPIGAARLKVAMDWAQEQILGVQVDPKFPEDHYVFVKDQDDDGAKVKVEMSEVVFVQSERNICTIHTTNQPIHVRSPLKELLLSFGTNRFIQVERSCFVNRDRISRVKTNKVWLMDANTTQVTIGGEFASELREFIREHS